MEEEPCRGKTGGGEINNVRRSTLNEAQIKTSTIKVKHSTVKQYTKVRD
jgi:hypothetical protein